MVGVGDFCSDQSKYLLPDFFDNSVARHMLQDSYFVHSNGMPRKGQGESGESYIVAPSMSFIIATAAK